MNDNAKQRQSTADAEAEKRTHDALRSFGNRASIEHELPLDLTQAMVSAAILAWTAKDAIRYMEWPTDTQRSEMLQTVALSYFGIWEHICTLNDLPPGRVIRAAGGILIAVDRLE